MLALKDLQADFIAGATVACVAIPLSLAIALASGVSPAVGLITAIVTGIVAAFFGGTPLAVSGPAAAMAVLIASVVQQHGLGGLLIVGMCSGLLQVLTGVLGLGTLIRYVPVPVIAGFTAGIGAIILIGQLPRALGLPAPDASHVIDVIKHLGELFHQSDVKAVALSLSTLAIIFGLPKIFPRLPAPLFAVLIPSFFVVAFGVDVASIGEIPNSLPAPKLPNFPESGYGAIFATVLVVYSLASLETLLSSSAVDKMTKGTRHDPDQELIGQGLANVAGALFGGIPSTGVIARSSLNIQSGAKGRRAAIVHSLLLMFAVYFMATTMSRIPIAVLAGVLLSIAIRMLSPRELMDLWRRSRIEASVYAVTFITIVFVDLIAGVKAGVIAALIIAAIRLGQTRTRVHTNGTVGPYRVYVGGALTFMSSGKVESIRQQLESLELDRGVVIDMSSITAIDASGAEQFVEAIHQLGGKGAKIALLGAIPTCANVLIACDHSGKVEGMFAASETDVQTILKGASDNNPLDRLVYGVERFRHESRGRYEGLFKQLTHTQSPHTLFITCCDSRIHPNLITSTEPGELFIVRNIGNIIPAFAAAGDNPAEGAAVEFSIGVLGVQEIIVCGHSGCGAMKAIVSNHVPAGLPSLQRWLDDAGAIGRLLPRGASPEQAAQFNVLKQLENLMTYPLVKKMVGQGEVRLHAWFYDISRNEVEEWDSEQGKFIPVGSALKPGFSGFRQVIKEDIS